LSCFYLRNIICTINLYLTLKEGATALLLAAGGGHLGVVRMLLGAGAKVDVTDNVNTSVSEMILHNASLRYVITYVTLYPILLLL
jgi:ankyrin repeat protein